VNLRPLRHSNAAAVLPAVLQSSQTNKGMCHRIGISPNTEHATLVAKFIVGMHWSNGSGHQAQWKALTFNVKTNSV
jgi:hypothetical protein